MRRVEYRLSYFPFDCDFFRNKKIKKLRRAHGSVGVLTYINILCRIYTSGYFYEFDTIEELAKDIAEDIAYDQMRKTATQVTETIHYLVEQDILDESLLRRGVISGLSIQEQYAESIQKLKRKVEIDIYSLLDEKKEEGDGVSGSTPKNEINSEEKAINSEEKAINSEEKQQRERERKKEITTHTLCAQGAPRCECESKEYGRRRNVILTDAEYTDLRDKIPDVDNYINRFSEKLHNHGYKYPNHHDALLSWWESDKRKTNTNIQNRKNNKLAVSSFDTEEFFQACLKKSYDQKGGQNET